MAKRLKFDEAGDSDELQALFDSIASEPEKPKLEVNNAPDDDGDNDELQSLFDSVAAEFGDTVESVDAPVAQMPTRIDEAVEAAPDVAAGSADEQGSDAVYNRIGQMTRHLHNTLRELGYDQALQEAADAIPDARQRLVYIAQMTEQAASRVLNATDVARPIQDKLQGDAAALEARWDKLFASQLSTEDFKSLASETKQFIGQVREGSKATNDQLMEIMMAQDFQDLTGQVIKKVVEMAQTLEQQMLAVLIESMPAERKKERNEGLMNGPVIKSEGRDDVVTSQEQVDDLLESLGF
ncbi:MAG: protein phosphatase CheZ [Rhodocyclaceae bacterium]|nr:protein phosphatase CheZ [Rhodocyclaceae bacterium]